MCIAWFLEQTAIISLFYCEAKLVRVSSRSEKKPLFGDKFHPSVCVCVCVCVCDLVSATKPFFIFSYNGTDESINPHI